MYPGVYFPWYWTCIQSPPVYKAKVCWSQGWSLYTSFTVFPLKWKITRYMYVLLMHFHSSLWIQYPTRQKSETLSILNRHPCPTEQITSENPNLLLSPGRNSLAQLPLHMFAVEQMSKHHLVPEQCLEKTRCHTGWCCQKYLSPEYIRSMEKTICCQGAQWMQLETGPICTIRSSLYWDGWHNYWWKNFIESNITLLQNIIL